MSEKKYKYIHIKQNNNELFNGKPVYRVYNNRTKEHLAMIFYYKQWKQYTFESREGCIFNNSCLRDILDFIENEIK